MAVFVVAHGAWSAGWVWKKMHPLMGARGHRLVTPTYTGVGERAHLANPDIDLETHIADILGVLEMEDLTRRQPDRPFLWRHGGDRRRRPRARAHQQLIYLDAFAPNDGDSLLDLVAPGALPQRQAGADGWRIPPRPMPPDTPPEDVAWCTPRRLPQPAKTFAQKLRLKNGPLTLPRHYIYCTRHPPDDTLPAVLRARQARGLGHLRDRRQP